MSDSIGRQPSLAAADLEHPLALERNDCGDRRRLDSVVVAPLICYGPGL